MDVSDLQQIASGNDKFATGFYGFVSEKEGNIICCPLLAHAGLSVLYQGAAGETAETLEFALNIQEPSVAPSGYQSLADVISNTKYPDLHVFNKIYVSNNITLNPTLEVVAKDSFKCDVESLSFDKSHEVANYINEWIVDKTEPTVKDLVSADSLDPSDGVVLINAAFFKAKWGQPSKEDALTTKPFSISNSETVNCEMMSMRAFLNSKYDHDLYAQVLELPCHFTNVNLIFVLPNDIDGIPRLESQLKNFDLSSLSQDMNIEDVRVNIPPFRIESNLDLKPVFEKMGLGSIFTPEANFSGDVESSEKFCVSKFIQKAVIEVYDHKNEEDAETAGSESPGCDVVQFDADHPFLVFVQLRGEDVNAVLFAGRVLNPTC